MLCKFKINAGNIFITNTNLESINAVSNEGNYPVTRKKQEREMNYPARTNVNICQTLRQKVKHFHRRQR
jgi:hypothetical protein